MEKKKKAVKEKRAPLSKEEVAEEMYKKQAEDAVGSTIEEVNAVFAKYGTKMYYFLDATPSKLEAAGKVVYQPAPAPEEVTETEDVETEGTED